MTKVFRYSGAAFFLKKISGLKSQFLDPRGPLRIADALKGARVVGCPIEVVAHVVLSLRNSRY